MKKYGLGMASLVGCVLFCAAALEFMLCLDDWGRISRYETLFQAKSLEHADGFPWLEKQQSGQPRFLSAPSGTEERNEFKKYATQYLRDHVGKDHFRGKKGMLRWDTSWNVHRIEIGSYIYLPRTKVGTPVRFGDENPRIFLIDTRPLGGVGNRGLFLVTRTDGNVERLTKDVLIQRLTEEP